MHLVVQDSRSVRQERIVKRREVSSEGLDSLLMHFQMIISGSCPARLLHERLMHLNGFLLSVPDHDGLITGWRSKEEFCKCGNSLVKKVGSAFCKKTSVLLAPDDDTTRPISDDPTALLVKIIP